MNYRVTFEELRTAGEEYGDLARQGESIVQRAQNIDLSQPDFGRVPWLQTRVWEAYQDHTRECIDALNDLSEVLHDADEGLHATADAYEEIERALTEAIQRFFEGVCAS